MAQLLNFHIPEIIHFLELIGVIIILVSSIKTFGMYVLSFFLTQSISGQTGVSNLSGLSTGI